MMRMPCYNHHKNNNHRNTCK